MSTPIERAAEALRDRPVDASVSPTAAVEVALTAALADRDALVAVARGAITQAFIDGKVEGVATAADAAVDAIVAHLLGKEGLHE